MRPSPMGEVVNPPVLGGAPFPVGTTQCHRSHPPAWERVDATTLVALSLTRNLPKKHGAPGLGELCPETASRRAEPTSRTAREAVLGTTKCTFGTTQCDHVPSRHRFSRIYSDKSPDFFMIQPPDTAEICYNTRRFERLRITLHEWGRGFDSLNVHHLRAHGV